MEKSKRGRVGRGGEGMGQRMKGFGAVRRVGEGKEWIERYGVARSSKEETEEKDRDVVGGGHAACSVYDNHENVWDYQQAKSSTRLVLPDASSIALVRRVERVRLPQSTT